MGEVYRAEDLKLGNVVALKFLAASLQNDAAALAGFHAEVRNARQVSHPNVCRVFDIGEVNGQHFLTMEYIDGEDLASLLRRIGRLPADKALETAHQICAGLAAAHDCGLLHRDLKPANIMLDGRGRVRITDFGLALSNEDATGRSETAGTPAYMAPEQLGKGQASVRSDIYSLGLVIYEVFTTRPGCLPDKAGVRCSFHLGLIRNGERVCSPCPDADSDLECGDCVSAETPRLAVVGGCIRVRRSAGELSSDDASVCMVCGHQSDRNSAHGRDSALRLLHLTGRPAGFRRSGARGLSRRGKIAPLSRTVALCCEDFPLGE